MPDRLLHAVIVPSDSQTSRGSQRRKDIAKRAVIDSDVSSAEAIAPQPGSTTLRGQVRGRFAPMMARMIEELFSSSIETVPYTAVGEQSASDGYYALEQLGDVGPLDPREDRVQSFDGQLVRQGTRRSHKRAVRTKTQSADNPFDAGAPPEIGLSVNASDVAWFNDVDGSVESATVQRTVNGEHGDLEIYDITEPSFDDPVLTYTLGYEDEYATDCVVWDDYGRPKEYSNNGITVASQWQRVYITEHEWEGDIVIESDRLRLIITRPGYTLEAYRWDDSAGSYTAVSLGTSDWELRDISLTDVGLCRIEAQFQFNNTASSATHSLNGTIVRGLDDVIWTTPVNEGSIPSGLETLLSPIADGTSTVAKPTMDLVKKSVIQS